MGKAPTTDQAFAGDERETSRGGNEVEPEKPPYRAD